MIRIDEEKVRLLMVREKIKTIEDLARKAGTTAFTIRKLFRGDGFYSATLAQLARALNCNPLDLLATEGYPDPHVGAPTVDLAVSLLREAMVGAG